MFYKVEHTLNETVRAFLFMEGNSPNQKLSQMIMQMKFCRTRSEIWIQISKKRLFSGSSPFHQVEARTECMCLLHEKGGGDLKPVNPTSPYGPH